MSKYRPCYVKCCEKNCINRSFPDSRLIQRGGKEYCPRCGSDNIAFVSYEYDDKNRIENDSIIRRFR